VSPPRGLPPVPSVDIHAGHPTGHLGFAPPVPPDPTSLVFGALADPTRRSIVEVLARDGDGTATQLATRFPVSRQAIAKHLATLVGAGLVRTERIGREQRHHLDPAVMAVAAAWMAEVSSSWAARLDVTPDRRA
jgi:DNA-binding transcriptional ArsR family regulator